ncbi:hypothetical protein ABK040_003553 [Willaertia magna]
MSAYQSSHATVCSSLISNNQLNSCVMQERKITILYGSQTGCAQEIAERIQRDAKRRHFQVKLSALDDFPIQHLFLPTNATTTTNHEEMDTQQQQGSLFIFVVSTTGQGDEPDNMKKFWTFLRRKSLTANCLNHLKFTVFGLGDSSYQKFNFVAKKLHRRLLQLGAKEFYTRGFADDQHPNGVDGTLVKWLVGLWDCVMKLYPLPAGVEIIQPTLLFEPRYKVHVNDVLMGSGGDNSVGQSQQQLVGQLGETLDYYSGLPSNAIVAKVIENSRMTSENHWQDVRHIVFDISSSSNGQEEEEPLLKYEPGDVVGFYPKNLHEPIYQLLNRLNLNGEQKIYIEKIDKDAPDFPFQNRAITIFELFERYLDIQGTPRRYFFELASHFAMDSEEKERLEYFGSSDGTDDLYRYNHKEKRTYVEVFEDFKSIKLPKLDFLLDLIPQMKPRYFSISSSQSMYPNQIHICVAIVKFTTPFKRTRFGVCTSWLTTLDPVNNNNIQIPIWITKGTMTLPKSLETPMIMVGPGTGVAPFRSFIQDRLIKLESSTGVPLGKSVIVFGNRNYNDDFLYKDDFEQLEEVEQMNFKLLTAFSRDQSNKFYVQHKLFQESKFIYDLVMNKHAYVYVAGNAKRMPTDVYNAFVKIIQQEGNITQEEAIKYLSQMDATKRYQQETWY